jgi:beta-glucosidase
MKFLKWLFIGLGSLIAALLLIVGLAFLYALHNPDHKIAPDDYPWAKNMSPGQCDSLAQVLVSQMSLEEKVDQMDGDGGWLGWIRLGIRFGVLRQFNIQYAGRNERLGIPPIAFSDGPRGVTVGRSTAFPMASARGATWDTELEQRVGDAIGKEMRALGANYFGGLCINLLRHPAWGRAQETYGEDPWHLGAMAVALTGSVQNHNVMVCAKHFALNSIENARFYVDVEVEPRTLHEVYLPHFKRFIDAGGASVMSAYNKLNGTYCGHNRDLLTGILRREWGFRGFVSSDWVWGLRDGVQGAQAGLDVEMPLPMHYGEKLVEAVRSGLVGESVIDESVRRIVRTKLAFVTRPDPMTYDPGLVACEPHRMLAREVAEKSMVLLKNEGALLPLDKKSLKTLAVIGRLADVPNLGDRGSSYFKPPYTVTLLQGIRNHVAENTEVLYDDGSDPARAAALTRNADAVVVVAGYDHRDEGEFIPQGGGTAEGEQQGMGGDRKSLNLHEADERLIAAVSGANPKTLVAVMGGSAVIMESWKNQVPAILMTWYPGMEGGNAFARIVFGDVNPGGRLPFTIPKTPQQLPPFEPFAKSIRYDYYHGYTLFDHSGDEPAWPFGFGLSYTQFSYDSVAVDRDYLTNGDTLRVYLTVRNTGERAGDEVTQAYISFPLDGREKPHKLLRGFKRFRLDAGEQKLLSFEIPVSELAFYDPERRNWTIDPGEYRILVGPSADEEHLIGAGFEIRLE